MENHTGLFKYAVNKFGLFRCLDDREEAPIQHRRWLCVIAAEPLRDDVKHYTFEAADDESAKLIYEVGEYE